MEYGRESMLEIKTTIINPMEMAFLCMISEQGLKQSGKMEKEMENAFTLPLKEICSFQNIKMEN